MAEVNVFPIGVGEDRMKQHVVQRLSIDGDFQRVHHNEVKREHVTGVMNLWKLDLLLDTVLEFPTLYPSLERSTNRVGYTWLTLGRIVFLFEPTQNRIGFELRVLLKQTFDFAPELGKRVGASAIGALRSFDLAWQATGIAIFTNRLLTHF